MTKTDYIYRYNFHRLKKECGLSYPKLEALTGMGRYNLMTMFNYKYPHQPKWCFERFEAFAAIFGVEVHELFIPPKDIIYPDNIKIEKSFFILFDEDEYKPNRQVIPIV